LKIDVNDIFIDAVILPVNVVRDHLPQVLETIKKKINIRPGSQDNFRLINVSPKNIKQTLINRIYLVMAIASGLDSCNPRSDRRGSVDAAITAELFTK